jgi:hypothetical protein
MPNAMIAHIAKLTQGFGRVLHSLPLNIEDKCQDTGSRFVGAVPRYPLDWVVPSYSRAAIGMPWRADGRQWRSPLANSKVPPLAHPAVAGLIFDGGLF